MFKLHLENDKHYGKHLINCINTVISTFLN